MTSPYRVSVLEFEVLSEVEGVRTPADFGALLDLMEFGDRSGVPDTDLREMCLMSLQDLEPAAAASVVLTYDLGEELRKGQIKQMSSAMPEEKLWEEYPDMAFHERLFHAASLVYAALPGQFPEPDAVRVTLEVEAEGPGQLEALEGPLAESFVIRLIADGLPENALLRRLFEEPLQGTSFPEAPAILWTVQCETLTETSARLAVISSGYWLDALRETRRYDSSAYPDEPQEARA